MNTQSRRELACSPDLFDDLVRELVGKGSAFRVRVFGDSMIPSVRNGDTIVAEPVAAAALKLGDLVLYRGLSGRHVVHRLVDIRDGGATLVTRGEAHDYCDPPFHPDQVIARVVRIERLRSDRPLLARARGRVGRLATAIARSIGGILVGAEGPSR